MLLDRPSSVSDRLSFNSRNRLKLGIFGSNLSSGKNATLAPERWDASWDNNQKLAVMSDDLGLEFFLPIGRWRGFGGITGYQETGFETLTWATGMLVATKRITVFSTIHAPLFHPVVAAKQMTTADQAGHGRFALNIVCGHNEDEFAMFGIPCLDNTERYEHGQEWITIVKRLWSEPDDFDFDGKFFQLKAVRSKPKPVGDSLPVILNAARSERGQAFAVRNADAFFTSAKSSEFDEQTGIVTPDLPVVTQTAPSDGAGGTPGSSGSSSSSGYSGSPGSGTSTGSGSDGAHGSAGGSTAPPAASPAVTSTPTDTPTTVDSSTTSTTGTPTPTTTTTTRPSDDPPGDH